MAPNRNSTLQAPACVRYRSSSVPVISISRSVSGCLAIRRSLMWRFMPDMKVWPEKPFDSTLSKATSTST